MAEIGGIGNIGFMNLNACRERHCLLSGWTNECANRGTFVDKRVYDCRTDEPTGTGDQD
jgi:hypothetical protein